MIPSFAAIAERIILLGPRVALGRVALDPEAMRPRNGDPVADGFLHRLARDFPLAREDDLIAVTVEFLRRHPALADWYDALLSTQNIEVTFLNGEPLIRPRDEGGRGREGEMWLDLSARIDPDALISLQFARMFRRPPQADDLLHWDVYARIFDIAVLGAPMQSRLRDIHTHLSGCENAPLLWQEVMARQIRLTRLPAYGGPPWAMQPQMPQLAQEIAAIRRARADFPAIRALLSRAQVARRPRLPAGLWPERAGLISCWLAALAPCPANTPRIQALDRYLHGKNLFVRRHIQSPAGNPGLESFRRSFDFLRPIRARKTSGAAQRYLARWRDFAFSAPSLDHIEFRIAPMGSVRDYHRAMDQYRAALSHVSRRSPRPGIPARAAPRFVVHFIRPRADAFRPGAAIRLPRLRMQLDKECAALHEFLHYTPGGVSSGRRPADLIVGIDVCNVERHAPIEHFAPHLRLLRAQRLEERFQRYLARRPDCFDRLQHARARARTTARNGYDRPLGLTLHAGEDYFHPLLGLREIWNAVMTFQMRPGDRIGHGLALGVDIAGFAQRYGGGAVAPRGMLLDAAVWLLRRVGTETAADPRVERALEDVCETLSRAIFGRAVSPHALKRVIDLRQLPVTYTEFNTWFPAVAGLGHGAGRAPGAPRDDVAEALEGELFDGGVARRRQEMIVIPTVFARRWMVEAMTLVQRQLTAQICSRQIVLEMNPSSNRAVGDFDGMRNHPILRLKLDKPDLRVAVSCDDPGNFGARIENEYALCAQAMRELGRSQDEIDAVLASFVEVTRKAAFGRVAFSNNEEDWQPERAAYPPDPYPPVRHDPEAGPD